MTRVFLFWFPLGAMWLMMAAEQPALTAVIARMADAEVNLAAFGVVFAVSLVIESPIIQMLAAATALADNKANYKVLMRLTHILAVSLTAIHLLVGLTPLYDFIVEGLLNVPSNIMETSRVPFIIMAPFAAAVGYRRLWQGVLIRHGKTWIVPVTMVSRLGLIAGVLAAGFVTRRLPGAMLAATSLAAGVSVAAIAAGILNWTLVWRTLPEAPDDGNLTIRELLKFYIPLSLTTIVFLVSQPLVTFGMARGLEPTRSLAVYPVINGFLFLFSSISLSFQETAIALLKRSNSNTRVLSRFAVVLALVTSGTMVLTGLTPVGEWWFRSVNGLGPSLLPLVRTPLLLLSIIPALLAYKAWYRARYVNSGQTGVLAQAVVFYTVTLFVCLLLGSAYVPLVGVTVAAMALVLAQGGENGFLLLRRGSLAASPPAVEPL